MNYANVVQNSSLKSYWRPNSGNVLQVRKSSLENSHDGLDAT